MRVMAGIKATRNIAQIKDLTDKIALEQEKVRAMMGRISVDLDNLLVMLQEAGITGVSGDYGDAQIVIPPGRKKTVIDPYKLLSEVKDIDTFIKCVSPSVTETRKVLTDPEIEKISTVIPATPGTPSVVVKWKEKKEYVDSEASPTAKAEVVDTKKSRLSRKIVLHTESR